MKITVLSTFDVWPAVDGGQTRYVSMWTRFSDANQVTILPYEFRNTEAERRYKLAPHVEVLLPRANEGDARHFHHMMHVTGLWMQDVLCIGDYSLSADYLQALRRQLETCDVIVASHPYLATMAFAWAPAGVLKVYEAHNVEYDIKDRYFRTGRASRNMMGRYLRQVEQAERLAVQQADHVTAVSEADRDRLVELYGVSPIKISVVPNGVNTAQARSLPPEARTALRGELGLAGRAVGVIVASSYGPNVESYRRTRLMLHEAGFTGTILLVGAIGNALQPDWPDVGFEERVFGFVSEELKVTLLEVADFAPHFVFDGAGTNLKLLDYMGNGVAIIANRFGVRGTEGDDWYWPAEDVAGLKAALADIAADPAQALARAERGRAVALAHFDWAPIAARFETGMRQGFPLSAAVAAKALLPVGG